MVFGKNELVRAGAVGLSLLICLSGIPLLHGTFAALVIAVLLQVYLPGYLLARLLGRANSPHPISRFVWILACGLILTVCIGAVARFLSLSVPVYLLILHAILLVLALLPPFRKTEVPSWQFKRQNLPRYALVLISCVIVVGVNYSSRYRFYGFEDQSIFISLIDWISTHPTVRLQDTPIRSRQIGVLNGDVRMETDGWSFTQAAWVWTSGVPASELVWYDLATLFIWTVPLIHFALAYELTESESVAAWTTIALTVAGLLTLDNIVYNPTYTAFGRYAAFQINVNRQAAIALFLPMSLLAGLAYLRSFSKIDLVVAFLGGLAMAVLHPIGAAILVFSIGITAALKWLASPDWISLRKYIPLAAVLGLLLLLPVIQRLSFFGLNSAPSMGDTTSAANPVLTQDVVYLPSLPVLGTTYIRRPGSVFYSPVIVLAVIAGLLIGLRWRRSLVAQYVFGTTALTLIFFFTPGLTSLIDKIGSFITLYALMFMLPVTIALGLALETVVNALSRLIAPRLATIAAGAAVLLTIVTLLVEPFPIYGSPRDQLRAYNKMQALHYMQPSQATLIAKLKALIPPDAITVMVVPWDVANLVIEDVPGALITGGRDQGINTAAAGDNRFFTNTDPAAPWLDSQDLDFLAKWKVTHIVMLADSTRVPQLLLQPDRFKLVGAPAGYVIFERQPNIQADADDALYAQMNKLYAALENQPRWGGGGFNLVMPGDDWTALANQWKGVLAAHSNDDRARLGLAFTETMMGSDTDALPLWQTLHDRYPDQILYADALASTLEAINPAQDTIAPLMAALKSSSDSMRVLAARRLLTDTFFYHLSHDQLQQVFGVTETDAMTWDRLANLDNADGIRKRVALLMGAGEWAKAKEWLDRLPVPNRTPEDMVARAAVALVTGDVDGALATLRPATDPDEITANERYQGGPWDNNLAAQDYYLIQGERARRNGATADAQTAYRQAMQAGSTIAAPYFLSQIVAPDQSAVLMDSAKAAWAKKYKTPLPQLSSLLTIADTHSLYATSPSVAHGQDEQTLIASALFSNIRPAYPIQSWRVKVITTDGSTEFAGTDVPAQFVDGALVSASTQLSLHTTIQSLTPALVYIEPRYDNRVTAAPQTVPVTLNRPPSAPIPAEASQPELKFGSDIVLKGYSVQTEGDQIAATLYWQANAAISEDYHVFVHVLNADGQQVGGQDSVPVDNGYPISQWRTGVVIADLHTFTLDRALPPGSYTVQLGLYRLSDGARLPISGNGGSPTDTTTIATLQR